MDAGADFSERLRVPLRWWVQGTMFAVSVWLAFIVAVPPALAWTITAIVGGALAVGLLSYGSMRVEVADGMLRAGRARIEAKFLGAAEALDRDATRRVAGPGADARAYLALRPYVKQSVRVGIADPADPTPYWLISTRRPDALAKAVTSAVAGVASGSRPDLG